MHRQRQQVARRLMVLLGFAAFATACAPLPPDTRELARAEHARQAEPPPAPAPAPAYHEQVQSWSLAAMAAVDASAVELHRDDSVVAILPIGALRAMQQAAERMTDAVNRQPPELVPEYRVIEGWAANAYAIALPERPLVTVNFGMIGLLQEDEAMWAAVFGHELAHLKRQHQQKRVERSDWGDKASGVLAVVLGFVGVPLAPLLTDAAATVVTRGYSRDDELEADALAMSYMRDAGYDPSAALRFHEQLAQRSGNPSGGLMSTHPGSQERLDAIRRQLALPTR